MKIGDIAVLFFILYGLLIPILAREFVEENIVTSIAIVGSCFIFAALFWSRRALLLNILIASYVFKTYLIRPYVDIFLPKIAFFEAEYIKSLNYFYNPAEAQVIYLSLVSLLFAWLIGLVITKTKRFNSYPAPWIFREIDKILVRPRLSFWLIWFVLTLLNFQTDIETWQGINTGESDVLFAYGMASMWAINLVLLFTYLFSKSYNLKSLPIYLLFPIFLQITIGIYSGSRNALFHVVILVSLYWIFNNFNNRIFKSHIKKILTVLGIFFPLILISGIMAHFAKLQLRYRGEFSITQLIVNFFTNTFQFSEILNSLYFNISIILHRLSSLKAQFYILNDNYIHNPGDLMTPLMILKRIINALTPGDIFENVLSISQLFDFIYLDQLINYNSEFWSIQGTLYVYFGHWIAPLVVFFLAIILGRYNHKFENLVRISPSFTVLSMVLILDFIEFGSLERVIPNNIVMQLSSFFIVIIFVKLVHGLLPMKQGKIK